MQQNELAQIKNWRKIKNNEIVIEFDNCPKSYKAVYNTCYNLLLADYYVEIWYAKGQRSPHIHIKNIQGLENLNSEQRHKYKELFIKRYVPQEFLPFVDFKMCEETRFVAEEDKSHFKYKTTKKLLGILNQDKINSIELKLLEQIEQESFKKQQRNVITSSGITNKIIQKISIINIAKKHGLDVDRHGFTLCPFHPDNNPSLKFYDNQGRFCCFGCNVKGNIIDFIYLLRKIGVKNVA